MSHCIYTLTNTTIYRNLHTSLFQVQTSSLLFHLSFSLKSAESGIGIVYAASHDIFFLVNFEQARGGWAELAQKLGGGNKR